MAPSWSATFLTRLGKSCSSSVPKFAASANGTKRSERADAKGVTDNELSGNRNLGGTIQRRPGSRKSVRDYNRPMALQGDGSSRSEQSLAIRLVVDRIPAFTWSAHAVGAEEFVSQRLRDYALLSLEESKCLRMQHA